MRRYGEQVLDSGRCNCGAPGKPFVTMDGGTGYVCAGCFAKQVRAFVGPIRP